jgi:hypothetical protein
MNEVIFTKVRVRVLTALSITLEFAILLFLSLVCSAAAQEADNNPGPLAVVECPFTATTNCTEASDTLSPSPVAGPCSGGGANLPVTAAASDNLVDGKIVVTITYTGTNCPTNSITTNWVPPTVISNWWTVTGVFAIPSSGTGLAASFTPCPGNGSVNFFEKWQHICDTNTSTASTQANFTIACPTFLGATFGKCPTTNSVINVTECWTGCVQGWYYMEQITGYSSTCGIPAPLTQEDPELFPADGCLVDQIGLDNMTAAQVLAWCGCSNCCLSANQVWKIGPLTNCLSCQTPNPGGISWCVTGPPTLWQLTVITFGVTNTCGPPLP